MLPAVVVAELEERRANSRGRIASLRDRLLRALLCENCPHLRVPWYEPDMEGALKEIIGVDAEASGPHYESLRKRRDPRAEEAPARRAPSAAGASQTPSEDGNVESGRTQTVRAMVHKPEVSVTTAGGRTSSTPRVNAPAVPLAPNAIGRPAFNANQTSGRTPQNAGVRNRGRLGLPLVLTWEYYSQHVCRKMSTARALLDAGTAMTPP